MFIKDNKTLTENKHYFTVKHVYKRVSKNYVAK